MIKAPSIWLLLWHLKWCNEPLEKNETLQCACGINWAKAEAAVHTVGRISDLLLGIRQTPVRILAQLCVPWQTDAALDFSVYLFSPVTQSCPTLGDPIWTAAHQASLSITNSWSLLKLMSIKLVMPSNHLILCHPFLLLPFYLYTGAINLMYKFICK